MTTKSRKTALTLTRKISVFSRRVVLTAKILSILIIASSLIYTGYRIKFYFDAHIFKWQSPIKLQTPLRILEKDKEAKKIMQTKPKTREKELLDAVFENFYYTIHVHESGQGTNTMGLNGYCIDKGEVNEVGFAPHLNYCFKDVVEQKKIVLLWLYNRLGTKCLSIEDCLSLYSGGSYSTLLIKP